MKLLTKLNIRYIFFALIVMTVSGIAIYITLSVVINKQLDEQLANNLSLIENQLALNPKSLSFEPFAEVTKVEKNAITIVFSDTLILNTEEKELEVYRQISAIKNINGQYFSITISKSKIETEDLLATLALVTLLSMVLLTIILILVNRGVARSVWLPFYKNLAIVEAFSISNKNPLNLGKTGITEFDKLNSVLTVLTHKIISDFQDQKQFSEDVSHELQTPLAIILSKIEALLSENNLSQSQAEAIKSIYSSVRRLSKLNRELILLSKIENNQFAGVENIDLKQLLLEKIDEFKELIQLKKLKLETGFTGGLSFSIHPSLAEILINNLLSNSIKHNSEGGTIRIEINGGIIKISNSGNVPIEHPERLFNRFYKVDPSSGSVGLGLAIVKIICDTSSIIIDYSFVKNKHTFTLNFPL